MAGSGPLMGLARFVWLAVPALGLAELGGHAHFAGRAPNLEQWQAIKEPVVQLRREREVVVVAPDWAEPLARHVLGPELMPLGDVARPDLTAYPRAIEVSILGREAAELSGWATLDEREVGKFRVRVRENPAPAKIRYNFVDHTTPAQAAVFEQGGRVPCRWREHAPRMTGGLHGHLAFPARRFQCSGGAYFFVGQTVVDDQEYRPRRCIWAHPTRDSLLIRYPEVPLGGIVRGYGALSWFLMRDGAGTPIEMQVKVNGDTIGQVVHRDQQGWSPFEFSTQQHSGHVAEVEFVISSAALQHRHFCFYADTR